MSEISLHPGELFVGKMQNNCREKNPYYNKQSDNAQHDNDPFSAEEIFFRNFFFVNCHRNPLQITRLKIMPPILKRPVAYYPVSFSPPFPHSVKLSPL